MAGGCSKTKRNVRRRRRLERRRRSSAPGSRTNRRTGLLRWWAQREGRPGALTAGCLLTGLGPRGFMVSGRQVRNATSAGSLFLCSSAIAVPSLDSRHEPPRAAR